MATLSALVRGLDAELRRLGYKDATMVWYRRCWRRMQEHFAAHGAGEFSLDAAMAWVDDRRPARMEPRPRTAQLARQPVSPQHQRRVMHSDRAPAPLSPGPAGQRCA